MSFEREKEKGKRPTPSVPKRLKQHYTLMMMLSVTDSVVSNTNINKGELTWHYPKAQLLIIQVVLIT